MRSKNHQIAWTLADYLESLEEQFAKEFPNKAEAEDKPEDEQQPSTREPDESSEDEPDKRKLLGLKEYKR